MKTLALTPVLFALFGLLAAADRAPAADAADPTGTWKIKSKLGTKNVEQTLKIEHKDGKVTGTITAGKMETKIEDGKFKDGELTFTVTAEAKGAAITAKFSGKVTGDTIKGTSTTEFGGKDYKSDFEGKREKK